MDDKLWEGVDSLLDHYACIAAGDVVLVIYAADSYEAAVWVSAALEARGVAHRRLWMAPLHDAGFEARLNQALPSPETVASRLVVLTFERDTMSHTGALARALERYPADRRAVFRMISTSPSLFRQALRARPDELSARNAALLERLMAAKRLRITTRGGTALEVGIDSARHRWISNRGRARAGGTVILPAGEVATFPAAIDGIHVADFAFNINAIVSRDARLNRHPVTLEIEDGRVTRYHCDDTAVMRFLEDCLDRHCAANVGELGFGTNFRVGRPIRMNSHINERRPGVHIGLGQHNQDPGVVPYQCPIHLDLIARGGKVWVDSDPVPIDLERIAPATAPHPAEPRDEDVFSPERHDLAEGDCCGIVTREGLQLASCPAA